MRTLALLLIAVLGCAACSGADEETGSAGATSTAPAAAEIDPRLTQGAANDIESVVVVMPLEPAAIAQPDGTLATFS